MKKINGFTLVELLGVIVILSLIVIVASPSIIEKLKKTEEKLDKASFALIESATDMYIDDNANSYPNIKGNTYCISLQQLVDSNKLKKSVLNVKTGEEIDLDTKLEVKIFDSKKTIAINNECTEYIIRPSYTDSTLNGADPELTTGMIPVIWINGNWVKADITQKWYDYSSQEWANAVTVTSTNRTQYDSDEWIGKTIPIEDINTMWVWIPRYKYQLFGTPADKNNPPSIEIVFESKNIKTVPTSPYKTGDWLTHPAFSFGENELNGFWVGKFETSTDDTTCNNTPNSTNCKNVNPLIKPNVSSLRYQNVSTQFETAQKFNNNTKYGFSTDGNIHMAKDSEWGAVAYLSQSQYGKNGNSMYEGANKEIYQNKSSGYITGSSNGTPSQSTTTTPQCVYNDIEDRVDGTGACGAGASTTGNIYGVYDMSGGAWEYTMSMYRPTSETPVTDKSGFGATTTTETLPTSEYWDRYTTETESTACSSGICYGSALSETSKWYSDYASFVYSSYPWSLRGGYYGVDAFAGVFIFINYDGSAGGDDSWRVVQTKP